jgi:hypothetical protein
MSALKGFDARPLWQRGKWTFAVLALVTLLVLGLVNRLTGGSTDTDRDLVLALGALISVYLGAEGWGDARVKSALARATQLAEPAQRGLSPRGSDAEDDNA